MLCHFRSDVWEADRNALSIGNAEFLDGQQSIVAGRTSRPRQPIGKTDVSNWLLWKRSWSRCGRATTNRRVNWRRCLQKTKRWRNSSASGGRGPLPWKKEPAGPRLTRPRSSKRTKEQIQKLLAQTKTAAQLNETQRINTKRSWLPEETAKEEAHKHQADF